MKTQRKAFVSGIIFVFVAILLCNVFFVTSDIILSKNDVCETKKVLDSYHGDTNNRGYEKVRLIYEKADQEYGETLDEYRNSANPVNRILASSNNYVRIPFVVIVLIVGIYYIIGCYNSYVRKR